MQPLKRRLQLCIDVPRLRVRFGYGGLGANELALHLDLLHLLRAQQLAKLFDVRLRSHSTPALAFDCRAEPIAPYPRRPVVDGHLVVVGGGVRRDT